MTTEWMQRMLLVGWLRVLFRDAEGREWVVRYERDSRDCDGEYCVLFE